MFDVKQHNACTDILIGFERNLFQKCSDKILLGILKKEKNDTMN